MLEKVRKFAPVNLKKALTFGSVAQLNRASDYGSEGLGFESLRNHERDCISSTISFFDTIRYPFRWRKS